MQLNQNTDYALRTLIYLASATKPVKTADIAQVFQISFNHLTKTVHQLVQLGYIESKQGKNGGIKLAVLPDQVNLRKIVEEMENNLAVVECLGENNKCIITSKCLLKSILKNATLSFLRELEYYTLQDLLTGKKSSLNLILNN